MGREIYVPENDKIWIDYFLTQAVQQGHGYSGIPYQRGHGLGSFFGRLFRSILPVAKRIGKSALKTVGKEALNMGANVLHDIGKGQNPKRSLKKHGKRVVKKVVKKAAQNIVQSGKGLGKRAVGSKNSVRKVGRPKKKKIDIFNGQTC